MTAGKMGLLVVQTQPHDRDEEEFNAWYDTEHLPERLGLPGFRSAQRWVAAEGEPKYLALYDLDSVDALNTEVYNAVSGPNYSPWSKRVLGRVAAFRRWAFEQILPMDQSSPVNAAGLLTVMMDVEAEHDSEFNVWYNREHIPNIAAVPGVLAARRFHGVSGQTGYLAVYHLADPSVPKSAAWERAVETPWTHRIRPLTHNRVLTTYRPYEPSV